MAPTGLEPTGDCYEAAFTYLFDNRDDDTLRLVHGEVAGQGKCEGFTLGHAWVVAKREPFDMVIDRSNGRNIVIPAFMYYDIGKVLQINNFHVYTFREAAQRVVDTGHYGSWELETEH